MQARTSMKSTRSSPSEFPTDDPHADLAPVEPDPQAEAMDAARGLPPAWPATPRPRST